MRQSVTLARRLAALEGRLAALARDLRCLPDGQRDQAMAVLESLIQSAGVLRRLVPDSADSERREARLRASEEELRLVTSQLPCLLWITDAALTVQRVTGAGAELGLLGGALTVGRRLAGSDGSPAYRLAVAAHRRALGGEPACFEAAADGREFDVRVEPLRDGGGRVIGCIGLAMDVTERRQAANRLRRLQAELAYVGRLSTLGSLAAGLAHELNQPLTAIVCYTQCCRELLHNGAARTEDLLQALDEVTAQGKRAGQIIRRVRDFARPKETARRAVEVDGLVRQVLDIIAWEAQRHGVDIRLDLAAGLPPVLADAVQIQQVLLDLLHNRIQSQAEQAGERRVAIRAAAAADGAVEIALAGSGTSPAAVLARLGEPFSADALQALGMGLTVCQSIIEAHGGRLWAAADPGQGVTFHFTLPPA